MIKFLSVMDIIFILVILISQAFYITKRSVMQSKLKIVLQALFIIVYLLINKILDMGIGVIENLSENPSVPVAMYLAYVVKYALGSFILLRTYANKEN